MAKQMIEQNVALLRAFVMREMQDFSLMHFKGVEKDRTDRASAVTAEICGKLMDRDEYWSVTFQSMSNMGQVNRALELPGRSRDPSQRIVCIFDTARPGRFSIQSDPGPLFIRDMSETFPGEASS